MVVGSGGECLFGLRPNCRSIGKVSIGKVYSLAISFSFTQPLTVCQDPGTHLMNFKSFPEIENIDANSAC